MAVWVKLKSIQNVEIKGVPQRLHPGDWVEVGRQQAELWEATGEAWIPTAELTMPPGAGVLVRGTPNPGCKVLDALPYITGVDHLPYPRTMIWDPALGCRLELLAVGFRLLDKWQVAAPLWHYDQLACHLGDEADRERTAAVVRDLRVPVYDERLVYVRRHPETQVFMEVWNEERADDGDGRLALLRALYRCKPVVCALPTTWRGS